ncbi:fungal-specific transcription factor domain-containing protein [Mycena floridula]|nr:fungal-specific transcription factor domain-containing protein [Mycena floridula]
MSLAGRKSQRACNACRKRKVKCHTVSRHSRCSTCIAANLPCIFSDNGEAPSKSYVENLERRVQATEAQLRKLAPDVDLETLIAVDLSQPSMEPSSFYQISPAQEYSPSPAEDALDDEHILVIEAPPRTFIIEQRVVPMTTGGMFFGHSSSHDLVRTAIAAKHNLSKQAPSDFDHTRHCRRPEFWVRRPWEFPKADRPHPIYDFPPPDLLASLVSSYFDKFNIIVPLLHRPTFDRLVADKMHLRNEDNFGSVLLLVIAVGSRWSDDPRVLLDGYDSKLTAGWKFFHQYANARHDSVFTWFEPATLYDLQIASLAVLFLYGRSATTLTSWTISGMALRRAIDAGAHRKRPGETRPSAERELWKRAWWSLMCHDRIASSQMGRPCAVQDEDVDVELPIECDDDCWENPDPKLAFKPEGKSTNVTCMIQFIKLTNLMMLALRELYPVNQSKAAFGLSLRLGDNSVAALDSASNKWLDELPDDLRWDPNREDPVLFAQSVSVNSGFCQLQILIHRPTLSASRISFSSLAICSNAARRCASILDAHRRRSAYPTPFALGHAFTAGVVLLLQAWTGKQAGLSVPPQRQMADVQKCLDYLTLCETRWSLAGRFRDILVDLGQGKLPEGPVHRKRSLREDDESIDSSSVQFSGPRPIAGTQRVNSARQRADNDMPFAFPMFGTDFVLPQDDVDEFFAQLQAMSENTYLYDAPAAPNTHSDIPETEIDWGKIFAP